jgi:cytochrome c biogenesis protein
MGGSPLNSVYKFFKSVKLAIVLILVITLFALLSTLIPQGKSLEEYKNMYSPTLLGLVTMSGLQSYTSSLLFWVPALMFILNLGVCTIDRLVSRARRKAARHFGPDLIHIGLLILAVGALITASVRREHDFKMYPGDAVKLSGGYAMKLTNFEFLKYPDGRPKAWISTVDVSKEGLPIRKDVKIEVNHPLALGNLKIYQTNYGNDGSIDLLNPSGQSAKMNIGQGLQDGASAVYFTSAHPSEDPTEGLAAHFEEWQGETFISDFDISAGHMLYDYRVVSVTSREYTGLRAATDPGFAFVLIALIIASVGLTLTSVNKGKGDL